MTPTQQAYREFLKTDDWRQIRAARLEMDDWECTRCHRTRNLQVHHLSYRNPWGQENLEDLVTLCQGCHYKTHKGAA